MDEVSLETLDERNAQFAEDLNLSAEAEAIIRKSEIERLAEKIMLKTIGANMGGMMAPEHARESVRLARDFFEELETPSARQGPESNPVPEDDEI